MGTLTPRGERRTTTIALVPATARMPGLGLRQGELQAARTGGLLRLAAVVLPTAEVVSVVIVVVSQPEEPHQPHD